MEGKRYRIVYEDESLMVVDKPSGMLVIPTPKAETNTLTDLLSAELKTRGVEARAHPCHRLDRETSGLIIYAKGKKAQQVMMAQFLERKVAKRYIAFAHGIIKNDKGSIRHAIFNRNKHRSEPALTHYTVLERRKDFSVVEVEPVTGRTNQIRIHMMKIGHPLVGEDLYAFRKDFALRFKRVALHAAEIAFTHPITGDKMRFSAPLPSDMAAFLERGR